VQYPVTVEALHELFSAYGKVEKIKVLEGRGKPQALVQYSDRLTATTPFAILQGHCMYGQGQHRVRRMLRHRRRCSDRATDGAEMVLLIDRLMWLCWSPGV
jgi:hypothetical protein